MVHPLKMLANDVQTAMRHQMMDVGDASRDRVLDRDHGARRPGLPAHAGERVLEGSRPAGDRNRADLAAGQMRIGARLALEDDLPCRIRRRRCHRLVRAGQIRPSVEALVVRLRYRRSRPAWPWRARGPWEYRRRAEPCQRAPPRWSGRPPARAAARVAHAARAGWGAAWRAAPEAARR